MRRQVIEPCVHEIRELKHLNISSQLRSILREWTGSRTKEYLKYSFEYIMYSFEYILVISKQDVSATKCHHYLHTVSERKSTRFFKIENESTCS